MWNGRGEAQHLEGNQSQAWRVDGCYCCCYTRENEWTEGTGSLSSSVKSLSFSTDRNIHLM
jgi:hypothetical protein